MSTKKIAIIDDDPLILDLYLRKFKDRGYEVIAMDDRSFSLEKLLAFAPGVILLDVIMPTKDGLDILEEMRVAFPSLPYVILLTNNDDKTIGEKAKELGARDCIVKVSKTPSEIADIVDNALKEA
ncbi:MAG: response regulator receiver protein [Parcubacteria group bacterium Gr01-1014_48]|nr:MAG: response regulator receiver protein [Parcubacteria group bacterium Greene0416_14]TSC73980.1 MAG: response regulator receiver protein [Parcubacteria group bacterium Gr01-1014_48]TSD00451.1 MAG: response regulator receiver protein [Parcubacteria group bacterium Greene1014_15]TSD07875.1 MAG: response regulator receiver protein [Parcubacteria group bacterium Greene0714_4]